MEVTIDGRSIYELLSSGDKEERAWNREQVSTAQSSEVTASYSSPSVRIPLPFGSIDGAFGRVNNGYITAVDLNAPAVVDVNPDYNRVTNFLGRLAIGRRVKKVLNLVEECFAELPEELRRQFERGYKPVGRSVDGYLVDGKGKNTTVIERIPESGALRVRIGGSGIMPRPFRDAGNFRAEMDILAEDTTKIMNAGLQRALSKGLIKENPDLTIRIGP
jgi:hypothetical protein